MLKEFKPALILLIALSVELWARATGCIGIESMALPGDRDTKNFFEAAGLIARAIVVHRSFEPTR